MTTNTLGFYCFVKKPVFTEFGEEFLNGNSQRRDEITLILKKATLMAVDGNKIHNHHTSSKELEPFAGVAILESGHMVELMDGTNFVLNEVYMGDDDHLHLSQYSVGGNVNAKTIPLEDGIVRYNEEAIKEFENGWPERNCIVAYTLF